MKVILIIIAIIIYLSIGGCIAAVEESNRFDKTGEYGLKPLIFFFWPVYVIIDKIKELINKLNK